VLRAAQFHELVAQLLEWVNRGGRRPLRAEDAHAACCRPDGARPDDPDRDAFEGGGLLPSPRATLGRPGFEECVETAVLGAAS